MTTLPAAATPMASRGRIGMAGTAADPVVGGPALAVSSRMATFAW